TSGTTGKPKGVMLEHHGLTNLKAYYDHVLRIGVEDRALLFASLSFDAACWEIFQALFCGATLYVPTKDTILNYQLFETYMAEHQITVAALPPTYAVYLKPEYMPSLRILFTAGSASSPELVQKWKDKVSYYNGYGPTENSVATSIWPVSEDPEAGSLISIGRPMPNQRVYIVDTHGHLLPVGVAGELCVAGAGLARGYLDRPELTAEVFVTSRFSGERMYRTGDLARWLPDGRLEYLGRIDHQVKIRGYRIELGEIEAKLQQVEAVQEVIVIAREDGQGQQQLCAYYVASEELAASELRHVLSEKLPSYMVPTHFVQLEAMPLTPNDKIDRKALPEPDGSGQTGADYAPPRTPVERSMAAIWQAVLGASTVGIHDNFFELGGDSIKSIQVSSRLLQQGYKLEMKDLFAYPTIAGLSPYVQAAGAKADQGAVTGEARLTPIQHWFFEQNFAEPHYFNQALLLHRAEGFEEAALRQAFAKLIEHHDALRMVYKAAPDGFTGWNRDVHEGKPLELSMFDYRDADHARELVESKASELQAGIDLREGPLLKLGLFRCADGDHLLIAIHHLVIDGVSWRILFEDLKTAYDQAVQGETIRLPHKTDSFQTWSEELRKAAASDELQRELAHWRDLEKAETAVLPKEDGQTGGLTLADSGTVTVEWSAEATEQLLKYANRAYNTNVNDLLLTALGLAVQDWTGQERLLISLEGHGREADAIGLELDLSRTIGWFTSQYPVLLTVEGSQALGKQIKRVKEDLRRIPRKGIGYGILRYVSELPEAERLRQEPEISFNYLGQFDEDLQNGAFGFSPYSSGQSVSEQTALQHALTFNGMVSGGRLTMTLLYNAKAFRLETIEHVAQLLHDRLVEVLEHCETKEQAELTPSDVQRKGLTIDELEELIRQAEHTGEVENVYALTPMQKGMLFHSLLEPKSGAYFQQATFELVGRFDVGAFAQSLELLVQRHTVLRTNIVNDSRQEPLQIVYRSKASEFYFEDVRDLGDAEQRAYVAAFAAKDRARGFDLAADALMRIGILQTGDTEYSFVWSFHHIVMDGWCISLLYQEVFGAYFAIRQKREVKLPQVTPYVRYMEWLDKQDAGQAAAYWKEYLSGYEQHTDLPNRKTADAKQRYELEKVSRFTGKPLSAALQRTAKAHQVTINTLLQTAWGIALQRYNNSTDVVFGSVVSGRPADIPGVEGIIGLFINTIPVRVQSEAGESFAHMLKRGQAQAIESNAYDTYPLYEIQAHTAQKQDLISHLLIFENYPLDEEIERIGERGPDTFEIRDARMNEQTNYDFTVTIMPGADIRIDFGYNAAVYDREDVERIQEHFIHLLEQATAKPDVSVDKLELVTAREKELLLNSFNDNTAEYPREQTIHGLFEEQVRRSAERIAVSFGNEHMTYRELNERANRLARQLRAHGVGPDVRVGLLAERSLEMIVGILATIKAGGAYVPLDPDYPQDRLQFMLEDSGSRVLLAQTHLLGAVSYAGAVLNLNDPSLYIGNGFNLEPINKPGDMAYIIYTSGTTGKPKGVMIEHRNVVRLLVHDKLQFDFNEQDVWTVFHSFCFDFSVWEMYGALLLGGRAVIVPKQVAQNPKAFAELLREEEVTVLNQTPTAFYALINEVMEQPERGQGRSVRYVIFGGEALSPMMLKPWRDRYPQTKLINMYGITETTVHVTYKEIGDQEITSNRSNIGRPIPTLTSYIFDAQQQLVPVGVVGELYVGGDGVARGYLNREELSAERFIDNPHKPGERLYRSGDLARMLPNGEMEYQGRIDHQVKIRGHRIELGEIESKLLHLEAVQEAIVLALDDSQGQKQLCAYYVASKELTAGELRETLSQELPSYMVPTFFVQVERMPLTTNGKVDRKALPAPEASLQSGQGYAAPSTQTEARLARIWQEVLGLEKVGVKDNFFEIGGHSLRAATLVARIQKELQISVPLRSVFEHPTVEELAAVMAGREKTGETSLPVAEERDYYPLSSVQKRMYILNQLQKNDISYNLPSVLRVEGLLDVKRIEEAFRALIARHESLRTSFEMVDGEPVQRVHAKADFSIEVREGSEQEAEEWMENFLRPFDLRKPPLMRVELIKLESERYIMQFDMHHIITDGASMGILVKELVRLYGGEELSPLRIQYKDYAVWQQGARARTYEKQEQYWLETLAGELPALEVPADYPRPAIRSFDGSRVNFELDAELTSAAKRLSEETGSTLFMVLLAAYQALLAHYSGQEDIIVGTPVAGRPLAELEPVVGMFVNTLALRAYPSENKTFLELLQEVKEQALGAFENQEFAFEELVEKLLHVQDASRNPLFDTMLVLQNNERQELKFDSVSFVHQERDYNVAKFDLTLYLIEEGDRINGSLEYSTKLFKAHTIEKYASDFAALLRTVTDQPNIRLGDIELADQVSVESVEFMF
ncbi:non-ribosomal peptide synthetase, partial [Paenibacillus tyrfis]|uniref:non-ribosomal peptide synthetase n=1 Tax=Paenibacillus tyrfis TaxID=1501230 RepID=UPI0026462FC3